MTDVVEEQRTTGLRPLTRWTGCRTRPDPKTSSRCITEQTFLDHTAQDAALEGGGRRLVFHPLQGETLGLVGESGWWQDDEGRTLMWLYPPTAGEVYFDGERITKQKTFAACAATCRWCFRIRILQ